MVVSQLQITVICFILADIHSLMQRENIFILQLTYRPHFMLTYKVEKTLLRGRVEPQPGLKSQKILFVVVYLLIYC